MSVGLDTSVTLRLLVGVPEDQTAIARKLVSQSSTPVAISDLVISETYFALRHHYGVPHATAVSAIASLLADARVQATGVAPTVLTEPDARAPEPRPGLIDRLIHADYNRQSLDVVTFDRDFGKLPDAQVLMST